MNEHVDIYAIHVGSRVNRLIARITMDNDAFAVHADSDTERRLLGRIESSTMTPHVLQDLGAIFDTPQLFASRVHSVEGCAFRDSTEVPLTERTPQLELKEQ